MQTPRLGTTRQQLRVQREPSPAALPHVLLPDESQVFRAFHVKHSISTWEPTPTLPARHPFGFTDFRAPFSPLRHEQESVDTPSETWHPVGKNAPIVRTRIRSSAGFGPCLSSDGGQADSHAGASRSARTPWNANRRQTPHRPTTAPLSGRCRHSNGISRIVQDNASHRTSRPHLGIS